MNSAAAVADRAARRAMTTVTTTRRGGMQQFFAAMEAKYGGSIPMDVGEQVITSPELNGNDLQRLFRHEITALHVPGFYDPISAADIGRELAADAIGCSASPSSSSKLRNWKVSTSRGLESSDVSTLGEHPPYNVVAAEAAAAEAAVAAAAIANPSSKADAAFVSRAHDEYFEGVLREFRSRRQPRQRLRIGSPNDIAPADDDDVEEEVHLDAASCLPPRLWPLDLLRLELDESWPGGAGLAREAAPSSSSASSSSRPYGGGLPRVMVGPTRWKRGFIHVDEMGPLDANSGLFSANIYLQLPDPDPNSGAGEKEQEKDEESRRRGRPPFKARPVLHVWPLGIRSRWDWYRNAVLLSGMSSQDPEAQMRLWRELGTPRTVSVSPGDLVVLCVQRPHCAIGFQSGVRVSLQCFLQHQGSKERLLIDC